MSRLILPRSCDGRLGRQIGDILGDDYVDHIREATRDYYAPMPLHGTPAWIHKGEFYPRAAGGGFASWSDLIAEASAGKRQDLVFNKVGTANIVGRGSTLWTVGNHPPVGLAPTNLTDAAPTRTTLGALAQTDPTGADTLHAITQFAMASAGPHTLVLYDRIWQGRPLISLNTIQAVTGVPTRWTGSEAVGNIIFIEVATVLPATAHTWTIQYIDQLGSAAENAAAVTGVASAAVNTFDMTGLWFVPLNAGDTGVREIENITLGTILASGALNLVMGHPIAFIPLTAANVPAMLDGINSALSLHQIKPGACLSFFVIAGVATATTFTGMSQMVSG